MFARWNRMAKLFTRLSKEITIAARAGGGDAASNPTLRRALVSARANNMPKDKIDAAIKRAQAKDGDQYQVVHYEGYGPHGIALIVEAATDNLTRTVANVRSHLKEGGGNLGAEGSVKFLFRHLGVFRLDPKGVDQEKLELDMIDHGLEEFGEGEGEKGEPQLVLRCGFTSFGSLEAALDSAGLTVLSAESEYVANTFVQLEEKPASEVLELVATLEGDEDVQRVFHNLG